MNRQGFTLLEVMVATTIMALAVGGLMSGLSTSMRNASRLTGHERAAMLAKSRMDELLLTPKLPKSTWLEGVFDPALTGGTRAGWRAQVTPFDLPPSPGPGSVYLERIDLQVWWESTAGRRTFPLEAFRRSVLSPEDVQAGVLLRR